MRASSSAWSAQSLAASNVPSLRGKLCCDVGLEIRRAEIAQDRVVASLVRLVESEQRRADQDKHTVAIDLRRLWRLRRRLRRLLRRLRLRAKQMRRNDHARRQCDDNQHIRCQQA